MTCIIPLARGLCPTARAVHQANDRPCYDNIIVTTAEIMTNSGRLAFDEVIKLPPMIYGTIRWKKNIGRPTDNLCSGFAIKVEERTPLEFRDIGGGHYEVVPGTGVWKLVTESAPCSPEPEAGEDYIIRFTVPGAHVNGFPGGTYRITPALTPRWNQIGRAHV